MSNLSLRINGQTYEFSIGDAIGQIPENETLVETLRERLHLTGTKLSCGEGACGCCTVLVDNKAVTSCVMLTCECEGKDIITIEGLQDPVTGELDPIQEAFFENNAFQCGYCTPGIIMAAKGLLLENSNPTDEELKEGLSGNYCRCISHYQVIKAVKWCLAGGAKS